MKKKALVSLAVVGLLLGVASPARASGWNSLLDRVDIGDTASETGHGLVGWGPVEKGTHGGNWGGIGNNGTRVVWYSDMAGNSSCTDVDENSAIVTLQNPYHYATEIRLRALDGIADDSFKVYVKNIYKNKWVQVGKYKDAGSDEIWKDHTFPLKGILRALPTLEIKIVATGKKWPSFCPYGQLAIDWVEVWGYEPILPPCSPCACLCEQKNI